jgi:DNA-binding GntR family transcriptional regulator
MRPALPPSSAIAAEIKARIESGELKSGDQLPTVDQLMGQYQVSRGTVAKALGILKDKGLITTRHGWGTHVV